MLPTLVVLAARPDGGHLLGPTEAGWVTLALRVPPDTAARTSPGAHEVHFGIERVASAGDSARSLREKSTFVLPR